MKNAWIAGLLVACSSEPAPPEHPHEHAHAHHGMPHRFEHADDWAKVFDAPDRDAWQKPDDVIAALELEPAMTVADIGAGTGYFSVRLARRVDKGEVIATDIEPDMVRYLGERARKEQLANLRAVQGGAADPALAPASVDRILVVDVWHHIDNRPAYAAALARALKPHGFVAIVDFTAEASHGPPREHRLSPESVMAELRGAGLDASLSPTKLPEQYIVIGRAR